MNKIHNKILSVITVFFVLTLSCGPGQQVAEPDISQIKITHAGDYQHVDRIAIIIEPRAHQLLVPIVENMMQVLGNSWKIQIFHGTQNGTFLKDSKLKEKIETGQIYLTQFDRENLTINGYNVLLLSPNFWGNVLGENVLIFQTDTVLCGGSIHKIEDFMKYDYVGAPWAQDKHEFFCHTYQTEKSGFRYAEITRHDTELSTKEYLKIRKHRILVGNGGLSFRKRSKTLKVLEHFMPRLTGGGLPNEDGFFSCVAQEPEGWLQAPQVEEAMKFSVETIFYKSPFGVHKPWLYLTKEHLSALEESCPEVTTILKPYYTKEKGKWSL